MTQHRIYCYTPTRRNYPITGRGNALDLDRFAFQQFVRSYRLLCQYGVPASVARESLWYTLWAGQIQPVTFVGYDEMSVAS